MNKQYLTKERFLVLKNELKDLKNDGRRRVAERLKRAKEFGDLSENSEYQEAREEQSLLERKIQEMEDVLRSSVIIEKNEEAATVVKVGSRVRLAKGEVFLTYTIVGSNESQPSEGLISNESPIGRAILGKKPGDKIKIRTPKGEAEYEVLSIE